MLSYVVFILFSSAASVTSRSESPNGIAYNIGLAVSILAENELWRGADGVIGLPLELSLLQHNDRFWLGAGLSWKIGTAGYHAEVRKVTANIFGLHGDLAYSVIASKHVDLKMGIGPALRYVSVDRGKWHVGSFESPGRPLPESHQNRFLVTVRATTSLLFHRPGRSGGLELTPIRFEYGPSMFQVSPCFSISKFF